MKKINWIATTGKAKISDNKIVYESELFTNQLGNQEVLTSMVKSDVEFENGYISFKVVSKDSNGFCQVVFNYDQQPMTIVGLNVQGGLYGIAKYNLINKSFESINSSGLSETFNTDREYQISIVVNGSKIELFIDNVLVATGYERIQSSQVALFFSSNKDITVTDIKIEPKKPKAFIVMQFSSEFNNLYSEVIKPVLEEFGFECERAEEVHTTNPILQDIIQSIRESTIIIADITPNNPNVFYEVGYAHASQKPTILMCNRDREKLPFDISGFRTLFYDNTISGKGLIEDSLRKYLQALT